MPYIEIVRGPDGKLMSAEEAEEERRKQLIENCLVGLQEEIDLFKSGDHSVSRMRAALKNAAEVGLSTHDLYKTVAQKLEYLEAKRERMTLREEKMSAKVVGKSLETLIANVDLSRSSISDLPSKLRDILGEVHSGDDELTVTGMLKKLLRLIEGDDLSKKPARISKFFSLMAKAEPGKNWMVDLVLVIIAENCMPKLGEHEYTSRDCIEKARPIAMRIWNVLKCVAIIDST